MSEPSPPHVEIKEYESTNVFSFNGRVDQRQFVIMTLAPYAFMLLAGLMGKGGVRLAEPGGILTAIGAIAGFWVSMATHAKRWHDLGESGWRALWQMVPVLNVIMWFRLALSEGQQAPNEYGDPPE